jgi:DNA-binding GntR family transcriptional regulator
MDNKTWGGRSLSPATPCGHVGARRPGQKGGNVFSPTPALLDRSSPVPLYHQLAQVLERAIASGALPTGSRLVNEVTLSEQLGLSRPTVRRAIEHLVDRGLLVRKRGVGTQVVQPGVRRPLQLTSLYDDLTTAGQAHRTDVLSLREEPATETVAEALGLPNGTPVLAVERVRFAGDQPLAILRNHLPAGMVPLTTEGLAAHGLYELMRRAGVRVQMASQTIGAVSARAGDARLLGERRGAALLTMQRRAFDDEGRAVEYGDHRYRASRYSFEFVLTG